jgi:hypothetical protein
MLIIYMVSALLFLMSIELHIHTRDAALSADHGMAVSFSAFADELLPATGSDEIKVNPDGLLKVNYGSVSLLAVFLLIALFALFVCCACIARLRTINTLLPPLPSYGTPPLRAPPL